MNAVAEERLPRQLRDFTPAPGVIKADYTDFVVEEEPLYEPGGSGTHTYFLLEKAGLSTMQAVGDVARALNVRRRDIGYAGLKDARAVTRQWMSVEHIEPERVKALAIPRIQILDVRLHGNKLRLGHLKGNRFRIRVRDTRPDRLPELREALEQLAERGAPNYFGTQRFGGRGDTWAIGQAIVLGERDEALDLMLGRASDRDHGTIRKARQLYDAGKFELASRAWPGMFHDERRALRLLARTGKPAKAFAAVDRTTKQFYVSSYQSHLFNRVVAARLEHGLAELWQGDLAWRHANGAVFQVEDPSVEQPRADAFEISPSGPLFGYRMTEPTGRQAELEAEVLQAEQLKPGAFRAGPNRAKGGRRPLRFQPRDADIRLGADERGAYLELGLSLSRGTYATVLLRELFDAESPTPGLEGSGASREPD